MAKRVLLTGGCGFIGHHVLEHILRNTDWEVIILDRLDISGTLERIRDISIWEKEQQRVKFIWHDLKSPINTFVRGEIGQVNYILHLAASTHVDRSIVDPILFVQDNVIGTTNLLHYARKLDSLEKCINFSTDEVFGPAPLGVAYKEWDRFNPGNPYAASKVGAEAMADAFANTYKLPLITTHTMNVFGERQHPEKFIPKTIRAVRDGETLTIHANKERTKAGSRFYIHARNVAAALLFLLEHGKILDGKGRDGKYNIVGEREVDNLELAQMIAGFMGKPLSYEMVDFHSSRPGHDLRYALDGSLMESLGWNYPKDLEQSLEKTVQWMLEHPKWL